MYAILALLIIGGAFLTSVYGDVDKGYDANWREQLEQENEQLLAENEGYGEDEQYLTTYNLDEIEVNNYYLEHDIEPTGYGAWQYVLENAGLLSIVSLLTIIVAAGIIANEYRWGTIKLLLIRPISRTQILLSKYVSVLLFAAFTLLFVLGFSFIVGAVTFGVEGLSPHILLDTNTGLEYVSALKQIMTEYGYGLVNLVMMATFAFMISTVFRNSSLAIGTAIFLMMAGSTIVGMFSERSWAKYILFANTDLQQYAPGYTPWIEGMTLSFSIMVLLVYYIIFMALSWIVFTKRDVAGN